MKKVLLTSTALVAFAGAAAAEVTLSGWAEMGVAGGDYYDYTEAQFFQDVDIDFTLSGETDNGLTFGANVDLDEAGSLGDPFDDGGYDVFVSGEFGTVSLGDIDGALDWAMADPAGIGSPGTIDDSETLHFGRQDTYLDGSYDGQILRYDYAYEGFGFAVSLEQDDTPEDDLASEDDRGGYLWGIGAKWAGEAGPGEVKVGIGYQAGDYGSVSFGDDDGDIVDISIALGENTSVWGISAGYYMDNGLSIGGVWSDWSGDDLDEGSHWAIGGGYTFDAFTIHANYGQHDFGGENGADLDTTGWAVAAGYDLGGGLSILAGYSNSTIKYEDEANGIDLDEDSIDSYSIGLSMSF